MTPLQEPAPQITYCDPCHGIEPMLIASPRDFHAAQGVVVALALLLLVLIV
jgi:hypothetical protein